MRHSPAAQSWQPQWAPVPYLLFSYRDLDVATCGFSEELVLGEGGFGRVYRGRLRTGLHIAVKRLDRRGQQACSCSNILMSAVLELYSYQVHSVTLQAHTYSCGKLLEGLQLHWKLQLPCKASGRGAGAPKVPKRSPQYCSMLHVSLSKCHSDLRLQEVIIYRRKFG